MTAYKNQHYIPQFYLKNFASDDLGKAINLYNLKSKKHIRNVPIRHQASRDYFYGKDLKIENFLAKLETE
ncbi:DUF4238 domain-containing protein, partial [Deltaproteobacteria bacterium OttesenSCG-928-M10]|nr:DUF4238 domain-containing protein [Deltaproteobacteria bacterium OttesenSCG-928-M10]